MVTETTWIVCAHCAWRNRACNADINSGPLEIQIRTGIVLDSATFALWFTCEYCGSRYRLPVHENAEIAGLPAEDDIKQMNNKETER